jgi:ABC-type phosphate transport system permease subunit
MKRTVEMVFTIIGIVLFGLPVLLSGIMLNAKDNPQIREDLESFMNSPEVQMEGEITSSDLGQMMDMMGSFAMFIMIASLIAIGLGILAAVFLKGNKKPKAAGIILIITAVIMTFATVFMGLFGGVSYLIAGIVALVRKPKTPVEEGTINY